MFQLAVIIFSDGEGEETDTHTRVGSNVYLAGSLQILGKKAKENTGGMS